ncbi:T9SS C-terminal target domain-containing protein [Parabacteroides sp. 52]|uniref:T9SS type A sorting domain-containing protein n=1 Tax=unclassified Parabacteroides TaxID=2649774 RepID=UPI0013D325C2|nr:MULTISPECIES: T9SS type A sorting domain-containing protein [unclassified Parabacteroides]MDH6533468.1 hypothetical protein [Parabacteroides sp. PM5-20]NDV54224.1 T9SS C-terminal target domain-containing protein [Parabacteroides sp. 52]
MEDKTNKSINRGKKKAFLILTLIGLLFFQPSFAKEIITIHSGKIEITFFDTRDQGMIPYSYNLQDWPAPAKEAVIEAFNIVEQSLVLTNKMSVSAIWSADLAAYNTIAEAYSSFVDVTHIQNVNNLDNRYKYPQELINQLMGGTRYAGNNITMAFNSTKDWCFSKHETPRYNQQDLITVTLHELAHGFGISSYQTKKKETKPYIYDKYIVDSNGHQLSDKTSKSLTNNSLYYIGPNILKMNNGEPLKLHAPENFTSASICHFDRIYTNDENGRLLIPGTSFGISTRFFGDYALAIFEDIGWTVKNSARLNMVSNENIHLDDVRVYTTAGTIHIENPNYDNLSIVIYTMDGKLVKKEIINNSESYIVSPHTVYVVRIANKTFKIRT